MKALLPATVKEAHKFPTEIRCHKIVRFQCGGRRGGKEKEKKKLHQI
jgi:hypothetical protein